jgi:CheY-like chemotaxis protein/HEAT repeat protein
MARRLAFLITSLFVLTGLAGSSAFAQEPVDAAAEAPPKSVLAKEPKTPEEHFDAILLMLRLARPELAARYLDALLQQEPDDAGLLRIREKHGSAAFLQLAQVKELQPQSQDLLERMTAAALREINDPAYVQGLIDKLQGSPREQAQTIDELKHLGPGAIPPLLKRMDDPQSAADRDLLLSTLVQLGKPAVAPLLGALDAPSTNLRATVITALGWLGGKEDVLPHLWYPAFAEEQPDGVRTAARAAVARILFGTTERTGLIPSFGVGQKVRAEALRHFRGEATWTPGEGGLIPLWNWDPSAGTVVEHRVSPQAASLYVGERFSRQALALSPTDQDAQALFLAFVLANDVHRTGWDKPIPEGPGTAHDLALVAGPELGQRVLALALESKNSAAAVAALRVLGQNGTRHLLLDGSARKTPLIQALNAPDPRVQFAAATTVMQLDPETPFPGAGRVVEILARTLSGPTQKRTVVVDPNVDRATNVAGLLTQLGYETDIATTGMRGFEMAADEGNVELAVLHLNTIRWELSQTIANLRADARTAAVPIAIYGPSGLSGRIRPLLEQNAPVIYLEEANSPQDVARTLQPFLAQLSPPPLTDAQRAEQMRAAAYWLRHIALGQRTRVFDLTAAEDALSNAVNDPALAGDALVALGAIGKASVQQRLAEATLAVGSEPAIREAAAIQLAFHIQRFGSLLKNGTLHELQTAWEAAMEPELKTALAGVIGSLNPNSDAVVRQLQAFPPATLPQP